jgi:hypothetical protein
MKDVADFYVSDRNSLNSRNNPHLFREKHMVMTSINALAQQYLAYCARQSQINQPIDNNEILFDTAAGYDLVLPNLVAFFALPDSAVDAANHLVSRLEDSYAAFQAALDAELLGQHNAALAAAGVAPAAVLTPAEQFNELRAFVAAVDPRTLYTNALHARLDPLVQVERATGTNPEHLQLEVNSNVQWHLARYFFALMEGGHAGATYAGVGVSNYTVDVVPTALKIFAGL